MAADADYIAQSSTYVVPQDVMTQANSTSLFSRKWETVAPKSPPSSADDPQRPPYFTVLQWNILADSLSGLSSTKGGFTNIATEEIEWRYRLPRIIKQIQDIGPDIIFLQEVDRYLDIASCLRELRYEGCVHLKPDLTAPDEAHGYRDGLAFFYNPDRVEINESEMVKEIYKLPKDPNVDIDAVAAGEDVELCPQNQVFLIAEATIDNKHKIILSTTHLKSTKTAEGESRRLQQIKTLYKWLEARAVKDNLPLILAGDLNATPTGPKYEPKVYNFLADTSVPTTTGSGTRSRPSSLQLSSAYARPVGEGHRLVEPEYTTLKYRTTGLAKHVIDYIWFTNNTIQLCERLALPDATEFEKTGLPNKTYPSDHVAIAARFRFRPEKEETVAGEVQAHRRRSADSHSVWSLLPALLYKFSM